LFKINGVHALTLPLNDIIDELSAFEQMIANDRRSCLRYDKYHGNRSARVFDINQMPDSIYHYIITDELIDMLTGYWGGRDVYLFDAVFVYTDAGSNSQPIHRDVSLMEFAPLSLLCDISSSSITTLFIQKTHRTSTDSKRIPAPLSTQHNAALFNSLCEKFA
jgi:hypothetical protein